MKVVRILFLFASCILVVQPAEPSREMSLDRLLNDFKQKMDTFYNTQGDSFELIIDFPGQVLMEQDYLPYVGGSLNNKFQENMAKVTDPLYKKGPIEEGSKEYSSPWAAAGGSAGAFAEDLLNRITNVDTDADTKLVECIGKFIDGFADADKVRKSLQKRTEKCQIYVADFFATMMKRRLEGVHLCSLNAQSQVVKSMNKSELNALYDVKLKIANIVMENVDTMVARYKDAPSQLDRLDPDEGVAHVQHALASLMNSTDDAIIDLELTGRGFLNNFAHCLAESQKMEDNTYENLRVHHKDCYDKTEQLMGYDYAITHALGCEHGDIVRQYSTIQKAIVSHNFAKLRGRTLSQTTPEFWGQLLQGIYDPRRIEKILKYWLKYKESFSHTKEEHSTSSSSMSFGGKVCIAGILCVGADHTSSSEKESFESASFEMTLMFDTTKITIHNEDWFPYFLFDQARGFKTRWGVAGYGKNEYIAEDTYAILKEIIICRNLQMIITSSSKSFMHTLNKRVTFAGISVPFLPYGISAKGGGGGKGMDEKNNTEGKSRSIELEMVAPFLCGRVIQKLEGFPEIKVEIQSHDAAAKKKLAAQIASLRKILESKEAQEAKEEKDKKAKEEKDQKHEEAKDEKDQKHKEEM